MSATSRLEVLGVEVLGVAVSSRLMRLWRGWFAPPVQPFVVNDALRSELGVSGRVEVPLELQDTFLLYGKTLDGVVGLSCAQFRRLEPAVRSALVRHQVVAGRRLVPSLASVTRDQRAKLKADGDGYRFVWWPDSLAECGDEPMRRFVADDLLTSRHVEVTNGTWRRAAAVLPGARSLAGTFADRSGPNCFGAVMGAAGVVGAEDEWTVREPFEDWLKSSTCPGGALEDPGTVLVWRDGEGALQHAAVTLGDGWALHKPSQGWMTPRKVLTVGDVKRRARRAGLRLSRRSIIGSKRTPADP